jgi:small subunit ribosomal protein S18
MTTQEAAATKRPFFRRKKSCPFSGKNAPAIDWKDVKTLSRYISERGKMMPSRITAVSQIKQRELAKAIKRARFMALMPYVRTEGGEQGSAGPRPDRGFGERSSYGEPRGDRGNSNFGGQ